MWLSRLWAVTRDVVLTGFGAWVIWRQVLAAVPDPYLIFAGLALASPAAADKLRAIISGGGSPGPPSPPPSPARSPGSSGGGDDGP